MDPMIQCALCVVGGSSSLPYTSENISSVMAGLESSHEEAEHHNSEDAGCSHGNQEQCSLFLSDEDGAQKSLQVGFMSLETGDPEATRMVFIVC